MWTTEMPRPITTVQYACWPRSSTTRVDQRTFAQRVVMDKANRCAAVIARLVQRGWCAPARTAGRGGATCCGSKPTATGSDRGSAAKALVQRQLNPPDDRCERDLFLHLMFVVGD